MRMYIDDIRNPKHTYDIISRSSDNAIHFMFHEGCPNFISFDHDLGIDEEGNDDTAMIVVKWMVNKDLDTPGWIPKDFNFNVHSANPIGTANITGYLNCYLKSRN